MPKELDEWEINRVATRQQIQDFLKQWKQLSAEKKRSYRRPNVIEGLADLGIPLPKLWEQVDGITLQDYTRGPEPELNTRQPPGEVYMFAPRHAPDELARQPYLYVKLKICTIVVDDGKEEQEAQVLSFKRDDSTTAPIRPYKSVRR